MHLGDVGEVSFDSPGRGPLHLGKSTMFAEADSFIEEPTVIQSLPPQPEQDEQEEEQRSPHNKSNIPSKLSPSLDVPSSSAAETVSSSNNGDGGAPETPSTRRRRIKVNREVEKIVVCQQSRYPISVCFSQACSQEKIWTTMSETLLHPKGHSPSVSESM
jgi:hypothetical protein